MVLTDIIEWLNQLNGVLSVESEGEAPSRLRVEFATVSLRDEVAWAVEHVVFGFEAHPASHGPTLFIYEA